MSGTVAVEVLTTPVVDYALAHCGIGFLQRVVVTAPTWVDALEGVDVTAQVVDAHGLVLSRPWRQHLDSVRGDVPLVLERPGIRLDPSALSTLDEETTAEVVVTVSWSVSWSVSGAVTGGVDGAVDRLGTDADRASTTTRTPVRVLATRQWTFDPAVPVLSLELLAAFVQPNHPQVAIVVTRAAAILGENTGNSSLRTTEVLPERRDAIVEAVFDAVLELTVHYAEPPPSWGLGQKVRSPGDVFTGHLGTCLDTTLALASCLEHVGIAPVIWLARGHAFLGYWRFDDLGLSEAATVQVASAANAVDLRRMGVLETVLATQLTRQLATRQHRPSRDLFRRATQSPRDTYFLRGSDELLGVVDIEMARLMRILPMPARRVRDDGVVELVEYQPAGPRQDPVTPGARTSPAASATAAGSTGSAGSPGPGGPPDPARPPPPPRVKAWKNALLDLTLRNKLLNLGPPLTMAPLVTPGEQLGLLGTLLQEGRTISVRAADDLAGAIAHEGQRDAYALSGDIQRAMLKRKATIYSGLAGEAHQAAMQRLRYRARTTLQETGANPLFVTLGRLDWTLGDRELSAPLLLAPVEIKGVVMPFRVEFDSSGAVTLNHSLLEKLRLEYGFTVPGLSGSDSQSELPTLPGTSVVDVDAVVTRVREAIAASGLPFRVESDALLAIIAFTGYLLWRDLDEHWERFLERPLVRHLALSPSDSFSRGEPPQLGDIDLDDVVASAPVPTDGAQAGAVAAARAGETFVLEGPPGTGKSQTITGIIADQLAHGRRVLFVAEKGAALDIVRTRLSEVGLLPFALDLHDENARPNEVRARLRAALTATASPDEDGYRMAAQDVAAAGAILEGYAERLHDRNAAGLSLYTAHAQRLARGAGPTLTVPLSAFPDLEAVRRAVAGSVSNLAALVPASSPAWGFATARPGDLDTLWPAVDHADRVVTAALEAVERLGPLSRPTLQQVATVEELQLAGWLLSPSATTPELLDESRQPRWGAARDELQRRTDSLRASSDAVLRRFDPSVVRVDVEPVRRRVREAAGSFFFGRKRRLLEAAAPLLVHALGGAGVGAKGLPTLVDEVAAVVDQARALGASWRALAGCGGLPTDLNVLSEQGWGKVTDALGAVERDRRLQDRLPWELARAVSTSRSSEGSISDSARLTLVAVSAALKTVFELTGGGDDDVRRFSRGRGLLRTWAATQPSRSADRPRGTDLGRWVTASEELAPLAAHLADARWQLLTGEIPPEDATAALDRGLSLASASERWEASGFGAFDADRQDRSVTRFVSASAGLRTGLTTALPAALVERRPFKAGALFGRVGQLEREIGRSRGGLSVRRLVEQYGEVIGAITPCVLVSPDSLARFIPPGAMSFDLVVFDEASQITVPDAVGALGRADAAVIAGDSKQMPPSEFGQLSTEDVDEIQTEFQVIPDEESILGEAVQAGVNRLWLSWHYRSQDETLIAFSNAAYYENRLSSFPAHPDTANDTGISFTRVAGTFIRSHRKGFGASSAGMPQDTASGMGAGPVREPGPQDAVPTSASPAGSADRPGLRTNPVEAAAVVAEVLHRWAAGERSIGVVTFNIQQRGLVEKLLWDSGVEGVAESLAAKADGLFVKNLENVQGDERDVILFSTGFSAAADGVLPLNFGPLNRSGGERRLNVAVTRARRRVMVFSSFEPEDLRVEQTSSVGIRDLRRYLEVAKYGVANILAVAPTRIGVDRHRDDIAGALRAAGLEVSAAVGLSDFQVDLAVGLPGQAPSLAVLLDSPAWAARRTTSDRDALPVTVLHELMGWPEVGRVWLPAWLRDRELVVGDLVRQAHAAAHLTVTPSAPLILAPMSST
ncbi:MAG: DUF4011 domain-containing protein, partial [Actinomycetota bacterium]|nr:DUF4011 domain-containing protein [Actinomycetota bacterium]